MVTRGQENITITTTTNEKDKEHILNNKAKRKRGRPPSKALKAAKGTGIIGRPKGDSAIINEYKARMIASPKSRKVLDTILDAALDNEHKHQSSAWKLVIDRILPVGLFEQDVLKNGSGGKNAIQINITGVGSVDHSLNSVEEEEEEVEEEEVEVEVDGMDVDSSSPSFEYGGANEQR